MSLKLFPSRLEPVFVERIWGARDLKPLFPEKTGLDKPIGEVWLTGHDCRFADGPFAGHTLADAWPKMPPEWIGPRALSKNFPLLVKFLFPEEKLSIQVHPPDDYAHRHEAEAGGAGKTEIWYALAAHAEAEVLVGLKRGMTPEAFRRAIGDGTVENCLEHIPVAAGDAIFVPAGTVHTMGPGMILCEIQEYSDLTYRVFDYNRLTTEGRPRALHIDKALDVINFNEPSGGKVQPVRIARAPVTETYFIACRYFALERWEFAERVAAATSPEQFDLLIFLAGNGRLDSARASANYAPGEVRFLPACLGAYQLHPDSPTALLRTYVPHIDRDFVRRLMKRGGTELAWSKLVFP